MFKLGPLGLGYYRDQGAADPGTQDGVPSQEHALWQGMRTTGQLRRDGGIAAPRSSDSSYK